MQLRTLFGSGLLTLAALGAVFGSADPAQATPVQAPPTALSFNLTCLIGGPSCGTTVFATVTLTQVDSKTVSVSESLASSNVFAGTGAGDALTFNVDVPNIVISNITPKTPGLFVIDTTPKGVPYGDFGYGIAYTGHGTSAPNYTSLSFTVSDSTSLALSDFVKNSAGYYFASDIGVPKVKDGYNTGNVAGNSDPTNPIPEPTSLILLGAGLIGLTIVARRSRPVALPIAV